MTHRYVPKNSPKGARPRPRLAVIAISFLATGTALAEQFEMVTHPQEVYGARKVESGAYDEAIRRLTISLGGAGQARSLRSPVVVNLCVAHTMKGNYDIAKQFCDQAVETGWSSGLAYNNRGVLKIALGQYEAARQDFEKAAGGLGGSAVARRNLKRVNVRIAQIQEQNRSKSIATAGLKEATEY